MRGERGIDPYKRCAFSHQCARVRRCVPPGGQGRPPLRVRTVSHWCTQICNGVPPAGVEPLPYAGLEDSTGLPMVHLLLRVPAAQSFSRLRRQLPLHKGAFAACHFAGCAHKICFCILRGRGKPRPYVTTKNNRVCAAWHRPFCQPPQPLPLVQSGSIANSLG